MKILIIDDERKIASFIKHGLEEEKYVIDIANNGVRGLELALNEQYDLILLDLLLPDMEGIQILNELREANVKTPILVLSARNETEFKVEALNAGADDFLCKPFSFEELTARIRAILRRAMPEKTTKLKCGDLVLDTISHMAIRYDREIELTTKEYALLEFMIRNKNRILSRANITQNVWKQNFDPDSNIIDVYIKRIRTKIEKKGAKKQLLQSVRGVGYRIRDIQTGD